MIIFSFLQDFDKESCISIYSKFPKKNKQDQNLFWGFYRSFIKNDISLCLLFAKIFVIIYFNIFG